MRSRGGGSPRPAYPQLFRRGLPGSRALRRRWTTARDGCLAPIIGFHITPGATGLWSEARVAASLSELSEPRCWARRHFVAGGRGQGGLGVLLQVPRAAELPKGLGRQLPEPDSPLKGQSLPSISVYLSFCSPFGWKSGNVCRE